MFTKNDLIELAKRFPFDQVQTKPPIQWEYHGFTQKLEFFPYSFDYPSSEQFIRITRANKNVLQPMGAYPNKGLLFWINSEYFDMGWEKISDFYHDYLLNAKFEPIDVQIWEKLVAEFCAELKSPLVLPLNPTDTFIRGMILYDWSMDMIFSAVAEYQDEFIYFYWETTA